MDDLNTVSPRITALLAGSAARRTGFDLAARKAALARLSASILAHRDAIAAAVASDLAKPAVEADLVEVLPVLSEIAHARRHLRSWMRPRRVMPTLMTLGTSAALYPQPKGVALVIAPWNFPFLLALSPVVSAIAAGNAVAVKPSELTPATSALIAQILPQALPGLVEVFEGGPEISQALLALPFDHIFFTGSPGVGKIVMAAAAKHLTPVTLELGGKSPNIFFKDVMAEDDAFFDKALEGFTMFALNQGEVCTCPSRALIHEDIYDAFMEKALKRVAAISQGDPLDANTMIGAQASSEQMEKILSYFDIGRQEGAEVLIGGARASLPGDMADGYYVQPTVLKGHNKMRVFQEEIFGPVVSVTTFKTDEEALEIANDTLYGLGAGIWTRDTNRAYRFGRGIQAGRVWTNCYHAYPAHAAFGGYKQSGIGRETHKMMLDHYQQTKNMLVSYSPNKLGFF
jgi:aldehyde dehydrogenase